MVFICQRSVMREVESQTRGIQRCFHVYDITLPQALLPPCCLISGKRDLLQSPEFSADINDAVAAVVAVSDDDSVRSEEDEHSMECA